MRKAILALALLGGVLQVFSQSVKQPKDSKELIIQAYTLGMNENYQEAIATLNEISVSDTNYLWSQRIAVGLLIDQNKHKEVESLSRRLLDYVWEERIDFHIYLIDALIAQNKFNEAKTAILNALEEYPLYHQFQVQQAEALFKSGEIEEAEALLKTIIKTHTLSPEAHFLLGQIAANNGRVVRAILSLHFAILSDPNMDDLRACYSLLENICNNDFSPKTKIHPKDLTLYKDIFELVESGIAKKQAYKSDLGIFYSLSNQIDLIVKSLEFKAGTNDFWMDFYVPFLVKVNQEKKIVPYTLAFLQVNKSDVVKDLVDKNKTAINALIDQASKFFSEAPQKNHFPIKGHTYDLPYRYGTGNNLFAVGDLNAAGERSGPWTFFNLHGNITSKLNYKAGKLDGKNEWLDDFGNVNQTYHFVNEEITGEVLTHYDETGIRNYKAFFKKGEIDGPVTNYYWNGLVKEYALFKENERNGYYYLLNYAGDTIGAGTYKEGKLEGPYTEYYPDGSIESRMNFMEGERHGKIEVFYQNGQLKKKGTYDQGKEVGKWEYFHDNGQLELYYLLTENGKSDGPFFELYPNGDTARTGFMKKGQLDGLTKDFTPDGKLLRKMWYKKGHIKSYQYYDSLGHILSEGSKLYKGYDQYGYPFIEGELDGSKGRQGKWKMYFRNGLVSKEWNYEDGIEQGACVEYFDNGKKSAEYFYEKGQIEGYAINYHRNGTIESEGWFEGGEAIGDWKEYNDLGQLTDHKYYLNGEVDRYYFEYGSNGKLIVRSFFKSGILHEIAYADTSGKIIQRCLFPNGNGKYEAPFLIADHTYVKGELAGGLRHGPFQFIYPNGVVDVQYQYRYGTLDGPYLSNHFSGQVYEKGTYLNGEKEGIWEKFYLNGKLRSKAFFHNGRQTGRFYNYYHSGKLKEASSVDAEGKEHGLDTLFHENGAISRIVPMHHGNIHGSYVVYDVFGEALYKKYYNGDEFYAYSYLKDGTWVEPILLKQSSVLQSYYNNGKLSNSYAVVNGKRNGVSETYYSNGQLWEKEHYENGTLDGPYESYYENGQIELKCKYKSGNYEGPYVAYDRSGKVLEEFNYVNGSKHGLAKYYIEGKLSYILNFYHGYIISVQKQ